MTEEFDVISHMEHNEIRDIGYNDLAVRLVMRGTAARSATLHWSTPTSYVKDADGKDVRGAKQFHRAILPVSIEALTKLSTILTEAVAYLQEKESEVVNTTPEEESDGEP